MKNSHRIFSIIAITFLVVYVNLLFYQKSHAAIPIFGGPIMLVTPCTNSGTLLTIGPPVGGLFFLPLTVAVKAYKNRNPTLGACTIGIYTPGGVCVIGPGITITTKGTITITMGTSRGNFFCRSH